MLETVNAATVDQLHADYSAFAVAHGACFVDGEALLAAELAARPARTSTTPPPLRRLINARPRRRRPATPSCWRGRRARSWTQPQASGLT